MKNTIKSFRIVVITNLYPPQMIGGYERSISDFSRLLRSRGHTVLVLTSNTNYLSRLSTSTDVDNADLTICRRLSLYGDWSDRGAYPFHPAKVASIAVGNSKIIEKEVQDFKPDVCLAGNIDFLGSIILEPLLDHHIPVLHYVMNGLPGYPPELTPQSSHYRYITCSDWVRESLHQHGYPTATAQTIYPGAAVEDFYQEKSPPHDFLRIAYASLLMQYKGADVLLEALWLLHNSGVSFNATLAGGTLEPEFVKALQEMVNSEGLQEKVKFVGTLSRAELQQLYKTHNVLVFPSRFQEPFGISQIEAMAAGLTLVTSGTGGAKEVIESGWDGLVFDSENPLALADALTSLTLDAENWEQISRRGQHRAMSKFSQTVAVEQLESAMEQIKTL